MRPSLVTAAVLTAALALAAPPPGGAYEPPQVVALASLRAASRIPVAVRFPGGFPQSVRLDVAAPGRNAAERARGFLVAYAALRGESQLRIYDPSVFGEAPAPRLVWRLTLEERGGPREVLVDAHNGSIALEHPPFASGDDLEDFDPDIEHAHGGPSFGVVPPRPRSRP